MRINYSSAIQGLYFNNLGPTGLTTDTATDPQTITLGRDGITVETIVDTNSNPAAGTTAVFVGETSVGSTPYSPLSLVITGSETWTNYSPKYYLAVNSPLSLSPLLTTGTTVLTLTTRRQQQLCVDRQ